MVSIIILSYNTKELLDKCLLSLFNKIKDFDFEVIVVDNASSDDTVEMVKDKFPKVTLVQSKENLGFAKGVNLGATFSKGEYILLLNSDIEIISPDLKQMFNFLKDNEDAAVIGGKLDNADGSTSKSYGNFYELREVWNMLFNEKESKRDILRSDQPVIVDWVSGGFMAVKKEIFLKLKGLDPHFFMYIEDMEFCYRINKSGLKVFYDPSIIVKHVGQGSSNRTFAIVNIFKGILYFYKKQKPLWQYYVVKSMLLAKGILAIAIGTVTNNSYLKNTYMQALKF